MKARTGRNVTGRTGKAEHNGKTEKDRQNRTAFRNDDRHGLHSTTIVCKVFADLVCIYLFNY